MFVLKSTYEKLEKENEQLKEKAGYWQDSFNEMQNQYYTIKTKLRKTGDDYNALVRSLNAVGVNKVGEINNLINLSPDEIKSLISLCHPDRHDGKESAKRLTQKFLQIRDAR